MSSSQRQSALREDVYKRKCWGRISSCEEGYIREEHSVGKWEMGSNIIFLYFIFMAMLGIISSGGRGRNFLVKKLRFKQNGGEDEYQVVGNFMRPC